ncbi:helix-turn-helix domain-containing protein [Paenalcaligenes suwonensis]|uniref:helix-turn-helix domain-containing protein n=1 Tax=Paenalcaligenes suwonensis TaxID=1202713 RepID=UPI001F60F26F|nr:helix-turn-helix domain-containing protein [Paenalcaligenes suwonensis]
MFEQLLASTDDATTLAILNRHISSRWFSTQSASNPVQGLRYAGRRWVDALVSQATLWQRGRSLRQVERKVKALSGRSLREWQTLVSTETAFFETAQDDRDVLSRVDWAALALDAGFSDQAHLSRAVKRITGFPPAEFARRFVEDESLWIYRLWV